MWQGMGIIKDGSVSGILPTNEVFAVHYPAYPSSVERAVETLGGIQGIVKVLPCLHFVDSYCNYFV